MAFWLARERRGQTSDWMQRFDPRFWTVNFPRPMMASVVATAPDALRVDCEFWHRGELAGLIWDSADTLDHPLLAYETCRDYRHCVLRFRWRSGGIVALDAVNGPTLTIEGRDAAGQPRSWYVRLWNYAEGTATDALIELPFSALGAGWTLPGEAVHPADIDRMFVSLVPPGHVPGSSERFAAVLRGWAELTGMRCEGAHATLEIGDPFLPVHGEQMASAYDDSCNQTPQRLVRQIERLGYRGRVIHYLGMSHYYRLQPDGAALLAAREGVLCEPARRWHAAYFAALDAAGLAPIASLSYELLAEACPPDFRQKFADGRDALTGWVPPSALLSPCHAGAAAFLAGVARELVALLQGAGCAVLFQIGEPWWWVDPERREIALYDASARTALASDLVDIGDLRLPLGTAQKALLDRAGSALAASTGALAQAVRDAAAGPCEILLLVFTPTILDPAMPELRRANMPTGWAHPAFDRLQLEDYDWVTGGREADRAAARAVTADRLGYPLAQRDYMSGFVLDPDDAETAWPRIDAALDEARAEGIAQRFVWALPQICRDGFTRLAPQEEDDLQAFDDIAYPLPLGRDASASPEFSTSVAVTASGHEHRNALWADARMRYDVGPGVRSEADLGVLLAFFRARLGPARAFRLRDPFDHSSNEMTGVPTATDQLLGTGDGARATFRLVKRYGDQERLVSRPVAGSVLVSVGGIATTQFTLGAAGELTLASAPAAGVEVRAGFLFDVPVRFAEDRIEVSALALGAGEAASVPLIEVREAS